MSTSADIFILGGSQIDFARNWQREGLEIFEMFADSLREAVANGNAGAGSELLIDRTGYI
ncbi:MAG: hypothetical protein O7F73_16380 [Gammaproteobacteria bacterium]|nr:hypothetical protein [Gammaproteobacteria bacterium]